MRVFKTDLGRWILVVAVINVDTYPYLASSDLTCRLEDTWIGVFWLIIRSIVPPDNKDTKLGSSDQETFLSVVKYIGVVLVHCATWKCVTAAVFGCVDISDVSG